MLSMTNVSRRKAVPAIAIVAALAVAASVALAGCTESARVSYNIRQDADNFNVARRLTVFNMRSLPAREAFLLGQVIRYADRAGEKDDPAIDLGKANNYAHRLITGDWRCDGGGERLPR